MIERAPLVSAIIPVYNGAAYIRETLESVLSQTYPNMEIVVVNDASTDKTALVLKSYTGRITYIERPINGGVAASRNSGIAASRGDLVAFIDSDDLWLPDRIARGVEAFREHPAAGLVATNTLIQDERSGSRVVSWTRVERTGKRPTQRLLEENFICTSSTLVGRSALDTEGVFDESFSSAEDYDLWYRIARRFEIVLLEEPLTVWRYRSASFSSNAERMVANVVRFYDKVLAIEEHEDERKIAARRRSEYRFKLGILQSIARDDEAARHTFRLVAKKGAPSLEVAIAIKLHAISPSLFRWVRSKRAGRAQETLTGLDLVV